MDNASQLVGNVMAILTALIEVMKWIAVSVQCIINFYSLLCIQVIKTFSIREGWWYIGIKGDGGVKSKGTRLLTEIEI